MASKGKGQSVCPECGYRFRGQGFDGIDAHWRAKHEDVMSYEDAWPLIESGAYESQPSKGSKPTQRAPKRELTLELLREGANYETAMSFPLPQNPSDELLEAARLNVLDFLDINSQKSTETKEEITKTLKAGFEKLLEIAILLRESLHDKGPLPDDGIPF